MPTHLSVKVTQHNYVAFCDLGLPHHSIVGANMNYSVVETRVVFGASNLTLYVV
jgi:hypothetical protein